MCNKRPRDAVTYALLEGGVALQIRVEIAPVAELKHSAEGLGVHFCNKVGQVGIWAHAWKFSATLCIQQDDPYISVLKRP